MLNTRAVLKIEKQRATKPKEEMKQNSKELQLFQKKAGQGSGMQRTENGRGKQKVQKDNKFQ